MRVCACACTREAMLLHPLSAMHVFGSSPSTGAPHKGATSHEGRCWEPQVDDKAIQQSLKGAYLSTFVSDASKEWNALREEILAELYNVGAPPSLCRSAVPLPACASLSGQATQIELDEFDLREDICSPSLPAPACILPQLSCPRILVHLPLASLQLWVLACTKS